MDNTKVKIDLLTNAIQELDRKMDQDILRYRRSVTEIRNAFRELVTDTATEIKSGPNSYPSLDPLNNLVRMPVGRWITSSGRNLNIRLMDTDHIKNCMDYLDKLSEEAIALIRRRGDKLIELSNELNHRGVKR